MVIKRLFSLLIIFLFISNSIRANASQQDTQSSRTIKIDSGLSIRNHDKGHYYKMIDWDQGQYSEFAYWEETEKGSIVDFMNFRVAFPANFSKSSRRYPAIVMLHGTNSSGRKDDGKYKYAPSDPRYDNNSKQLEHAGKNHYEAINRLDGESRAFPGIVIFPQSSYNAGWGEEERLFIARFLEWMIKNYQVDPDRIAIHGLSNGAKGVWKFASSRPDLIAAALPMSGVGTDIDSMTSLLSTKPIWIFQGDQDRNPSLSYAMRWYDSLVAKGGTPRITVYENTGHYTWNKAYNEPDFFSWMREQNIKTIHILGGDQREDPCTEPFGESVAMGFSAGFLEYQWVRNGKDVPGATDRFYTAEKEGLYYVKFKRRTDSTWDESFAVDVFFDQPYETETFIPEITAFGSTTLPVYGDDRSLRLKASPGFTAYEWYKDETLIEDFNGKELILNNEQGSLFRSEDVGAYTVRAVDRCGNVSMLSEPVIVEFDSTLLLSAGKMRTAAPAVYPNPFRESVNLEFSDHSLLNQPLIIYDQTGRKVGREIVTGKRMTLDLSALRPGMYILSIGNRRIRVVKVAK